MLCILAFLAESLVAKSHRIGPGAGGCRADQVLSAVALSVLLGPCRHVSINIASFSACFTLRPPCPHSLPFKHRRSARRVRVSAKLSGFERYSLFLGRHQRLWRSNLSA